MYNVTAIAKQRDRKPSSSEIPFHSKRNRQAMNITTSGFPVTLSELELRVERLSQLVELLTVRVSELQDKLQGHEAVVASLSRTKANKSGFSDEAPPL